MLPLMLVLGAACVPELEPHVPPRAGVESYAPHGVAEAAGPTEQTLPRPVRTNPDGTATLTAGDAIFFSHTHDLLQRSLRPRAIPGGWRLVAGSGGLSLEASQSAVRVSSARGGVAELHTRINGWEPAWGPFAVVPCEGIRDLSCDVRLARTDPATGVEEWWIAEPRGLHHGFIVSRAGQYQLVLHHGGWQAELEGSRDAGWKSVEGERWSYVGARAWTSHGDERGLQLDARGETTTLTVGMDFSDMYIVVDPTLIDPLWNQAGVHGGDNLGYLTTGGDFNNDGFGDVSIVGSWSSVVLGGGSTGPEPCDECRGSADGGVGDIDGDGLTDVSFVGLDAVFLSTSDRATKLSIHGSRAKIGDWDDDGFDDLFYWPLNPVEANGIDVLSGRPDGFSHHYTKAQLRPLPYADGFDHATAGRNGDIGDVNGDGIIDFVASGPGCVQQSSRPYAIHQPSDVFFFPGRSPEPHLYSTWRWSDINPADPCSTSYADVAPDINGDGYDDILINGEDTVWWVMGGADGPTGEPRRLGTWTPMHGDGITVTGDGIGDVNGDGYGDVAVAWSGTVDVHLGGPDGPLAEPIWRLIIGTMDFSDVRTSAWIGDLNGDGLAEIFASALLEYIPAPDLPPGWYYVEAGMVGIWSGAVVDDIDQDGILNADDCRPWHPDTAEVPQDRCDEDGDGTIACLLDSDGDGFGGTVTLLSLGSTCAALPPGDCDDADPAWHPGADDLPDDDLDQDCDGAWMCHADLDGDGFGAVRPVEGIPCSVLPAVVDVSDCDDEAVQAHPGGVETPGNSIDEDCDGKLLCARDEDGDGWGGQVLATSTDLSCVHPGLSAGSEDCDDHDAAVNPRAFDSGADDLDNNCDGWWMCIIDGDRDGWNGIIQLLFAERCSNLPAWGQPSGDCDDYQAGTNPGQEQETYGEYDQNCDGITICYYDWDGDDDGDPNAPFVESRIRKDSFTWICTDQSYGPIVTASGDCDDTDPEVNGHRANERPEDGRDQDCDGLRACPLDADGDGFGHNQRAANNVPGLPGRWFEQIEDPTCTTPGYAPLALATDCNDAVAEAHPGGVEVVGNAIDEDCDWSLACWSDVDRDGWGSSSARSIGYQAGVSGGWCAQRGLSVAAFPGDCAPTDPQRSPGVQELRSNGIDEDCDGVDGFALRVLPPVPGPGGTLSLRVGGADPGARVWLAMSTSGPGGPWCPGGLPGDCVGLQQPRLLGTATANASGIAAWGVTVPPGTPPGRHAWLQAWTISGGAGLATGVEEVIVGMP